MTDWIVFAEEWILLLLLAWTADCNAAAAISCCNCACWMDADNWLTSGLTLPENDVDVLGCSIVRLDVICGLLTDPRYICEASFPLALLQS